jgi:hypothetical protein
MPPLATSTRSTGSSALGPRRRTTSLNNLFARFRRTALPTLRLATMPTRRPPAVLCRPKATKSGLTHLRPSWYTSSKSAFRRRAAGCLRPPPLPLSVKPTGDDVPCAADGRRPPGPPSIASSLESRGSGCVGVDLAGTFFSFRHDSQIPPVGDGLHHCRELFDRRRSETSHPTRLPTLCQPNRFVSPPLPFSRPREIFSCRPPPYMLDYAPRPVDIDETLFNQSGVARKAGFPHLLIFLWKTPRVGSPSWGAVGGRAS